VKFFFKPEKDDKVKKKKTVPTVETSIQLENLLFQKPTYSGMVPTWNVLCMNVNQFIDKINKPKRSGLLAVKSTLKLIERHERKENCTTSDK